MKSRRLIWRPSLGIVRLIAARTIPHDAELPAPGSERVPGAIGGGARLDRLGSLFSARRTWLSHLIGGFLSRLYTGLLLL